MSFVSRVVSENDCEFTKLHFDHRDGMAPDQLFVQLIAMVIRVAGKGVWREYLTEFINDFCQLDPDDSGFWEPTSNLRSAYGEWREKTAAHTCQIKARVQFA
ncbi:hypothetical protein KQI52_08165 [bacterium]|nr:hypothetical protein [bacterium]